MSGEAVLKLAEGSATEGASFASNVTGEKNRQSAIKKVASFGATGFLALVFLIAALFFGAGNVIPGAITERLYETDMQYADMVESKKIVLQQALRDGNFPDDTAAILKEKGYIVGYVGADGGFVENNKAGRELAIKAGDEIISADDFVRKVNSDVGLYAAMTEATYDRSAGYYDEAAEEVFKELGTSRSNFVLGEDFEMVMKRVLGQGNAVEINSVEMVEKTTTDAEGNTTTSYEPELTGGGASAAGEAADFIEQVRQKNPAGSAEESAMDAADTLKVADKVALEQRSSLFYALMMENIHMMKAGDGNQSKINDTMNYLTRNVETEVVDVKTGEVKKVQGSALEAPSLVAILAGTKADKEKVADYSEERVLTTVRNKLAGTNYSPVEGTVASAEDKVKGSIGRMVTGSTVAEEGILESVTPTIRQSLVENGFESYQGINGGEFLAMGAVNLGRRLAQVSGGTGGDEAAVKQYARVNQTVLAMDAEMDRQTKSPFDASSKNTFLGSIMYKIAMIQIKNPEIGNLATVMRNFGEMIGKSMAEILPSTLADDGDEGFLTDFGECETTDRIGAKATVGCSTVAVFDESTLDDPFQNQEFINLVERDTKLDASGTRKVIPGSELGNFITNSVGRKLPIGVMDGGILESLNEGNWFEEVPFVSDILAMVSQWLGASDEDKRIASGEAYVNSAGNENWDELKWAQRYVALARTTDMLRTHSSDQTAYREMKYFEGNENPVMAFLRENQVVAQK